jgi:hypothetical protein
MKGYPRLRTHTRKGANGQVWTSYYWDGRGKMAKDIPLGNDPRLAIERWKEIEQGTGWKPSAPKKISVRVPGRRRKFADELWDDLPAWGKRMYLNAEKRAAMLGRPFVLTVNELAGVIHRAGGRCEVSGIEFDTSGDRHPFAASVDRIDSSIGYRVDNIRVVCLIANFAMNTWGEGPLRVLSARIAEREAERCGNVQQAECGLV